MTVIGQSAANPGATEDQKHFYSTAAQSPLAINGSSDEELDLGTIWTALQRRRRLALSVLGVSLILGGLILSYQRLRHPVYAGGFKLLVSDPISKDDQNSQEGEGSNLESLALRRSTAKVSPELIEVLTSPLLLQPLAQRLGVSEKRIARNLTVSSTSPARSPQSGILDVKLLWENPEDGETILRALSKHYLGYALSQRQEKLTQGLTFLDQQAPELQSRVNQLQQRLSTFRRTYGYVAPEQRAADIQLRQQAQISQLGELQIKEAQLLGIAAAARRGELNSSQLPGGVSAGLLGELSEVEKSLAVAEADYTSNSPQVQELRERRARLRPLLQKRQLDATNAALSENRAQQQELRRQLGGLASQFNRNPDQIKRYEELQQELNVASENLTSYIKARENFRLQVAQRTEPWKVISPPEFGSRPVKPDIGRGLALSVLLGGLGGLGLALLRDRMDHVFHEPEELKEALGLPLLGLVPNLPKRGQQTISEMIEGLEGGERFAMKESLRNLFASFRLLRADKALRLILITSTSQAEGKTTTAALFAQTMADLGQRVLLVDADMRRPRVHRYLGVDNVSGLSNLLTNPLPPSFAMVQAAIQKGSNGLDVLTAGDAPPDAAKLLSSARCGELCETIRQLPGYDVVLFDSPPALELADPVLLSEHLDGLVFLVSIQRIDRSLPEQALRRIRASGVDVLGVVANYVLSPAKSASGYRYRYGYGYGYRYGYGYGYGYEAAKNHYLQPEKEEPATTAAPISAKQRLLRHTKRVLGWLDRRD